MMYLLSVWIVNPTEKNSVGVFKFLPYYQDEIVQHRPGIVQMGGEGKQDLASQQSALLRLSWNWTLRHWDRDTLPPVNSRESRSKKAPQSTGCLEHTLKDCISSLSLQREIKILRLLVLVPKGRQNNNEPLCIATLLFQVCLVFFQKVCVASFFFSGIREKNFTIYRSQAKSCPKLYLKDV